LSYPKEIVTTPIEGRLLWTGTESAYRHQIEQKKAQRNGTSQLSTLSMEFNGSNIHVIVINHKLSTLVKFKGCQLTTSEALFLWRTIAYC
jgi:hypothetical protein